MLAHDVIQTLRIDQRKLLAWLVKVLVGVGESLQELASIIILNVLPVQTEPARDPARNRNLFAWLVGRVVIDGVTGEVCIEFLLHQRRDRSRVRPSREAQRQRYVRA